MIEFYMKKIKILLTLILLIPCFFACKTTEVLQQEPEVKNEDLNILFAGDIMAHKPNFSRGRFNETYSDIETILKQNDLSLANIETPVTDSRDYSSYPFFNVHTPYVRAAINAGFNVFSLSNNHSNDQDLEGIISTKKVFDNIREETKDSQRQVYSSGLKNSPQSPYTYEVIDIKGYKVLFLAVTMILNRSNYNEYINYVKNTESSRKIFIDYLKNLRNNEPCDLFIISIHADVPEYVLTISENEKTFYHQVLDAGVDIVWANHAHVAKGWDIITDEDNIQRKIIFYSMGNTISGQRWEPDFADPSNSRDYTGDGYMCHVRFNKDKSGIKIEEVKPVLITTYITPEWYFEIRILNNDFIQKLKDKGLKKWSSYLEQRKILMEQIKGMVNGY